MKDVDILDTTHQDLITSFVLNTMLQYVGMIWIIETHEQLKFHIQKNMHSLYKQDLYKDKKSK